MTNDRLTKIDETGGSTRYNHLTVSDNCGNPFLCSIKIVLNQSSLKSIIQSMSQRISQMNLVDYRLGAVLSRMGLVKKEDIDQALTVGFDRKLPIGKVLVLQEKISTRLLRLGLHAQWMIKNQLLAEDDAIQAVRLASRNRWTFQDALTSIGVEANPTKGSRLGELLAEAGILTEACVKEMLHLTAATDLPLGRVLIARGLVGEAIISHAINLQRSLREEVVTAEQAVGLLKGACDELGCVNFRTGELLVAARHIDKIQMDQALEAALTTKKPIGEVLIQLGHIHKCQLNKAIEIQGLLRQNQLGYFDALNLLQKVDADISYSTDAMHSDIVDTDIVDKDRTLSLYEFLKLVDYFRDGKLNALVLKLAEEHDFVGEVLRTAGLEPERLTVKESLKAIMESSSMLALVLERYCPEDSECILFSQAVISTINSNERSVEMGLLDYVARFHLFE